MTSDLGNKFIGVDICAGKQPLTWAMIDDRLRLCSLQHGEMADVMSKIREVGYAFLAITSPSRTNIGLLKNAILRKRLVSTPRKGRLPEMRVAEYEMHLAGLPYTRTPSQLYKCSRLLQKGFALYQRLDEFGCRPYPASEAVYQWMEVSPEAAFSILLEGQSLLKPKTLEGRLQRQLLLFDLNLSIPDPMFFFEEVTRHRLLQGILPLDCVLSISDLNALIAAYTAWLAVNQPRQVNVFGIAQESLIYLPGGTAMQSKPSHLVSLQFETTISNETLFQENSFD